MTTEEEDEQAERHMFKLFAGIIEAVHWKDVRVRVATLRALQRASLSLIASHPLRAIPKGNGDAGVLRLMEVLTEWVSQQPLCEQNGMPEASA